MQLAKVMTPQPMVVDMDTTLEKIKWIFENNSFRHLLVTDHKQLIGLISDRDVLANLSPTVGTRKETSKDALLLNKRAHQIMSHLPESLQPDNSVFDAIEIFYKKKISCLAVVDDSNIPVGIITTHDIFKVLYQQYNAKK